MNTPEMYQSVAITLNDGTLIVFSGRAGVFPGDERIIVSVKFTEPKTLPAGCSFGMIDEESLASPSVLPPTGAEEGLPGKIEGATGTDRGK